MYRNSVQVSFLSCLVGGLEMSIETTYTQAREHLATFLDKAVQDREVIIVRRRNGGDAAIIAADELASLMETAHLLSSPRNAQRLLAALDQALRGEGRKMTLAELRQEVGLTEDEVGQD
jgi:antitoxin YefM